MRWAAYAGVSVTLAAGVVVKAMHQRANFYAASVYLAQSTANLMILTNALLLAVGVFMLGLQRLFYGPLRPLEVEQLYERSWFAVTETCLALGIFRGEMGGWFLAMFLSLLAAKVWGWIGEGRVEVLEQQPPTNPRLFHSRLAASLAISILFNTSMLQYCINTVLHQARPDMMVMFGFEFALLSVQSLSTAARYAISLAEILVVRRQKHARMLERRAELRAAQDTSSSDQATETPAEPEIDDADLEVPGWEEKGRYIFYLDLITDFQKLLLYMAFFWILLMFYGLPIHIVRDVLLTFRSFFKRIADFRRYKNATRDMNARYPDATPDEVSREDVCIICREEMRPFQPDGAAASDESLNNNQPLASSLNERMRPKKLPCGHILHFSCLRSWLERQQICPTCRRPVVVTQQIQVGTDGAGQQGAGPAPGGGMPADRNQRQEHGVNQARIFQFGPLRVVFGRGRGNLLGDLANQVNDGGPARRLPQPPNGDGAQQYGFGFGFGRQPPQAEATNHPRGQGADVLSQLHQLEQQISQEISNLRASAHQLALVRMLQGELARLRMAQAASSSNGASDATAIPPSNPMPTNHSASQMLVQHGQQQILAAGSDQLPPGLTLPEGWTMMPLQRVEQPTSAMSSLPTPPIPIGSSATGAQAPSSEPSPPGEIANQTQRLSNGLPLPQHSSTNLPSTGLSNGTAIRESVNTTQHIQLPGSTAPSNPNLSNTSLGGQVDEHQNTAENAENNEIPLWGSSTTANNAAPDRSEVHASNPASSGSNGFQDGGDGSQSEPKATPNSGRGKAVSVEDVVDDDA